VELCLGHGFRRKHLSVFGVLLAKGLTSIFGSSTVLYSQYNKKNEAAT
jgi:hypothetical protein